jgi:hypothetical protein
VTARAQAPAPADGPVAWTARIDASGRVELQRGRLTVGVLQPGAFTTNWLGGEFSAAGRATGTNAALGVIRLPGGMIDTRLDWSHTGSVLRCRYALTTRTAMRLNALYVAADLPDRAVAGARLDVDGAPLELPRTRGITHLLSQPARDLALHLPRGGTLAVKHTRPTPTLVQDSRQWGPSFTLRMGAQTPQAWQPGETYVLDISMNTDGPLRVIVEAGSGPLTLAAGPDWVPLAVEQDIAPGSALDFRALRPTSGIAGADGRVVARTDGHFAFERRPEMPVRFYGVNLCFTAQYLDAAQADHLAQRLACLGYNAVRLHHYEGELIKSSAADSVTPDPVRLDQLEYLVAALKREGLYLTTDLFVSRPVRVGEVWPGETEPIRMDEFKMAVPVNARAFANWQAFARNLLTHRNPHTGLTWAEDPAVAWICMINEGNPENFLGGLSPRLTRDWQAAWNRWLALTYGSRAALQTAWGDDPRGEPTQGSVPLWTDVGGPTPRSRDLLAFLSATETDTFDRMRRFLRDELGCRALFTNRNGWNNRLATQQARAAYDYVDDHFYVDHPEFIEKSWRLPSRCANRSPIADGLPGGAGNAFLRLTGKPFAITEYNYSGPGRFRGVGGILTGAIGALQDWDGIWRFAYSHSRDNLTAPAAAGYFDLASDPLNQAAERATLCLYLRGDMRPAPHRISIVVPPAAARPANTAVTPPWRELALVTRVGTQLAPAAAADPNELTIDSGRRDMTANGLDLPPYAAETGAALRTNLISRGWVRAGDWNPDDGVVASETRELRLNGIEDTMVLDTPRTAGGYAPSGITITTASFAATPRDADATVWISSLDDQPIATSHRLLLTHLTDLQNTGARFGESERRTLLAWGHLPHLVRSGRAEVIIRVAAPARFHVWALSTSGRRVAELPVAVRDGGLAVTLDVRGAEGARLMYEVAIPR